MKTMILMLSSLLLSTSALAADGKIDADNGKQIFEADPTKCMSCHANGEHFGDKAKSLSDVDQWVRRCDINFGTNWFEEDVLDVVAYLNRDYYKFPETEETANNADTKTKDK